MRTYTTLPLLLFLLFFAKGHCGNIVVYNQSIITINPKTILYVQGDFISASSRDIGVRNAGEIHLTGNLVNRDARLFYWSTNGYADFSTIDTVSEMVSTNLQMRGDVYFIGKDIQYITDSGNGIFFANIHIYNEVVLNSDIHVQDSVVLKKDLNLNGHNLKLFAYDEFDYWGGTGVIEGESDTSKIIGDGEIIAIKGTGDASLEHLKTLGFDLYLKDNAVVRLTRQNKATGTVANGSIDKIFNLSAMSGSLAIDSIILHYFDRDFTTAKHYSSNFSVWMYDSLSSPPTQRFPSVADTIQKTVKATIGTDVPIANRRLLFTLANTECGTLPPISLGENTNACEGDTVTLQNILHDGSSYYYSWYQNSDTGLINLNAAQSTLNVTQEGTYILHIRNNSGCENTDTARVWFRPKPNPEIRINDFSRKCVGDTFWFKYQENTPSSELNIATILWNFGDDYTASNSDSVYHTYTISEAYTSELHQDITLSVISDYGCRGDATTSVDIANMPYPVVEERRIITENTREFRALNNVGWKPITEQTMQTTWYVSDTIVSTGDSLIFTFPEFDTYNIRLKMLFQEVCENETSVWVTIRERADVKLSVEKNDFCQNEDIVFTNATEIYHSSDTVISYFLYIADTTILTNTTILDFSDPSTRWATQNTGTYAVRLVAEAGSWRRESTDTIRVHPNPIINFGKEIQTCRSSITLQPQDNGTSYLWSDNTADATLDIEQDGQYSLTLTNTHGCTANESVQITLNTAISTGLSQDTAHCGELTLSISYPNGTYQWTNTHSTTLETSRAIAITESGTYIATLTDSICQATDTITVDILKVPALNIGQDTGICANESITIAIEPEEQVTYQWSGAAQHTGHTTTIHTQGTYHVKATHQNGCENSRSITVVSKSTPNFNLGATKLLCDTMVDFSLIEESGAASITWTFPDNSQQVGHLFSTSQVGMHTVVVEYTNGCRATDSVNIQRGESGLTADFLLASAIKRGDTVKLVNTSQPDDLQYQWEISNGFRSNEESPSYWFITEGEFEVRLTVSDGSFCPSSKRKFIYVSSDGQKLPGGERTPEDDETQDTLSENYLTTFVDVKLYPNPNHGDFSVNVSLSTQANLYVLLADPLGRTLDQKVLRNQSEYQLDYRLNRLQAGVYLLKLWSGKESKDFKVIVTK